MFAVHYKIGLVIVSVLISIGAAYAALSLADRMRSAGTASGRRWWLLGGSGAMGAGIWSMHYLGMRAVHLPVPVFYYWPVVLLSLLMAIAASAVALTVVSAESLDWRRLLTGGVLMGAGIGGMHYTGMAAMRSSAMEHYTPWIVVVSLVAAVGFSWMALWIVFAVRDSEERGAEMLRVAGGTVMGLGIAAMHYIAMSASHFMPSTMAFSTVGTVRVTTLGEIGIAVTTALILLAALGTAAVDKRRLHDLREAHQKLEAAQEALLETERQLRDVNTMLSELSIRDGLTGLHNRRYFDTALNTEWRRAVRKNVPLAVLMIDVDFFKALNDRFGHQRGDDCLRDIARILEDGPRRAHDVVARYGGEEFVVLLPDADSNAAAMIGELIRRAVQSAGIESADTTVADVVTVSVGACSVMPEKSGDCSELVAAADLALYAAKRLGKNRVESATEFLVTA